MGVKAQKAKDLFEQGYNCSQAVFGAFAEELGVDFDVALKLSSSFGGGMGRMREVCGAVSGMLMVAGIKYGYNSPSDDVSKAEHYRLVQELANEFKEKHDSIICRELLNLNVEIDSPEPSPRTAEYYKTRSCADFVYDAAEIIENYMNNR